jgi:hypothetical protein
MMKQGDYYGPEPRSPATFKPEEDANNQIYLVN